MLRLFLCLGMIEVVAAVEALLNQELQFDKIIVQDPEGKYRCLQSMSDIVLVNTDTDTGLFDGIDLCIDKYPHDYYYLQGADDVLLNKKFLINFDESRMTQDPDIYFERIKIVGEGRQRVWPPGCFVKKGIVLPPHFGSVYRSNVLTRIRMRDFASDGNVGADTAWFYSVGVDDLNMAYMDCISFEMAAGGISNNGRYAAFKNMKSMIVKLKKRNYPYVLASLRYIFAVLIKSVYIRRNN